MPQTKTPSVIPAHLLDVAAEIAAEEPAIADWLTGVEEGWFLRDFVPRPDRPEVFDEQAGFCFNRDPVSFLIGGNAAGTTEAAAYKTANYLLRDQPPPRKNTPFWIISNTYDQVCDVCWLEKLEGHGHIPDCEINWDGVSWLNKAKGWPKSVPLKPWPGRPGRNWQIVFKSYEQGRRALQASSIGGFWFSEQFPLPLFLETLRGCRECMFPGGQFAEFTPVEPELSLWVEAVMEDPPKGWRFYRANTEENEVNLAEGWLEQFLSVIPEEMRDSRMTGALAGFEGVIYQSFMPAIHVIDEKHILFPSGAYHAMGTDWGASIEHPHATIWAYRDGMGDWVIYDEYWSASQNKITLDHVTEVLARCEAWGWPVEELDPKDSKPPHKRLRLENTASYGLNYADPSRPGEINEWNVRGIPTAPARNAIFEGIDCVRTLLGVNPATRRPRLLISKNCKHLIQEIRKYRWMRGRRPEQGNYLNPKVALAQPLKRDDDCADALRYLLFSLSQANRRQPSSVRHAARAPKAVQLATKAAGRTRQSSRSIGQGNRGMFKGNR